MHVFRVLESSLRLGGCFYSSKSSAELLPSSKAGPYSLIHSDWWMNILWLHHRQVRTKTAYGQLMQQDSSKPLKIEHCQKRRQSVDSLFLKSSCCKWSRAFICVLLRVMRCSSLPRGLLLSLEPRLVWLLLREGLWHLTVHLGLSYCLPVCSCSLPYLPFAWQAQPSYCLGDSVLAGKNFPFRGKKQFSCYY